ncbi:MAG: FkbM family methyltransferase [Bacteroidota bacterium]
MAMSMAALFRQLPDFKGKQRLAKYLLKADIQQAKDLQVTGKSGINYLLPNLVENVGFNIFINGINEPETCRLLNSIIPQNGFFIDIGANIGSITVPVCKSRPDIKALAIEAAPWIYAYLQRNVQDNQINNVKLINCAAYDQDGLQKDFFSPHDKYGKGSLASVFTDQAVKVQTRTIDALLKEMNITKVDAIKADIEGFEYFAFKGAKELLSRKDAPMIFFEFVDWAETRAQNLEAGAAQRLLIEYGYSLYLVDNNNKRNKIDGHLTTGASNILAVKE